MTVRRAPLVIATINGRPLRFVALTLLAGKPPFVLWDDVLSVARIGFLARRFKTKKLLADFGDKIMRVDTADGAKIAVPAWMAGAALSAETANGHLDPSVLTAFIAEIDHMVGVGFAALLSVAPVAGTA